MGRAWPLGRLQRRRERRGRSRQLPSVGRCPARSPEDGLVEVDMLTFRDNSWYQSGNSGVVRDRQREGQRESASERRHGGPSCRPQPLAPPSFPPWLHSLDGRVGTAPGPHRAGGGPHLVATVGPCGEGAMCLRLLAAGGGRPHLGRVLARWVLGVPSRARASGRRVAE